MSDSESEIQVQGQDPETSDSESETDNNPAESATERQISVTRGNDTFQVTVNASATVADVFAELSDSLGDGYTTLTDKNGTVYEGDDILGPEDSYTAG